MMTLLQVISREMFLFVHIVLRSSISANLLKTKMPTTFKKFENDLVIMIHSLTYGKVHSTACAEPHLFAKWDSV